MDDISDVSQVDQQPAEGPDLLDVDTMLAALVRTVTKRDGIEIPICLHVNGLLVTGMLVGGRAWAEAAAEHHSGNDFGREMYTAWEATFAEQDPELVEVPKYVHVKNARTIFGDEYVPNGEVEFFWRGRLTQVDGWNLGQLTVAG